MKKITKTLLLMLIVLLPSLARTARADEVSDWNQRIFQAARAAQTPPLDMTRVAAMVHAAIFDAVNGVERRYLPAYVKQYAPKKTSARAAAVQAAYAMLVHLYPNQKSLFDEQRAASLAAITEGEEAENRKSVERGIEWGQVVADMIFEWRSTDGYAPAPAPFMGGNAIGQWRPTPPAMASGAGPQFATMMPWVILYPSQFRPDGPPALTSERYVADFNETRTMGSASSTSRTSDQTVAALFWASTGTSYFWNSAAIKLAAEHPTSLIKNARLFALLNIAIADAAIACWDAKYTYQFWRPITAIRLADSDPNPETEIDSVWTPLKATPAHPEYPSGHSTLSAAAARILANFFGEQTHFVVDSDAMPDVTRTFSSFSAALDEVANARVFAGIHFRSACEDGRALGQEVGDYVLANALQRAF